MVVHCLTFRIGNSGVTITNGVVLDLNSNLGRIAFFCSFSSSSRNVSPYPICNIVMESTRGAWSSLISVPFLVLARSFGAGFA